MVITVNPQLLQVVVGPVSVLYGQPIPVFGGTVTGLLSRDTGSVAVTFSTTATGLAPAGAYPITAKIAGPAAGNYALTVTPGTLWISPAPSQTTLAASAVSIMAGSSLTMTAGVATTTSGIPTGTVSILDAGTLVASSVLNSSGGFIFSSGTFAAGTHSLTAVYAGDANFTGSTSTPTIVNVASGGSTASPDFSFTASGITSQTVVSGSPASFIFTAQSQGNLSSAINLTATGLPPGATASFNPANIPPGASSPTVTLTISTATQARGSSASSIFFGLLVFPLIGLTRRRALRMSPVVVLFMLGGITGCGDRVGSGALSLSPVVSYAVTVTGTATGPTGAILSHSFVVNLGIRSGA